MRIGPLSLLSRTSDRKTINLASWHSPHSLTWRWIMSLRRHPFAWPKPHASANTVGFGAGLGTLLSFHAYRTNGGWQWELSALWHGLHFSQQRPMWFKNMFERVSRERDEAQRDLRKAQREIDLVRHGAARAANPSAGAHLN
ncbi:MAG: hypothetical protein KIS86_13015 [Devosia sp.]|nr:hypothetical protein [Devosia sp.]